MPLTNNVILTYCDVYRILKRKGLFIPDADLLIAAAGIDLKALLATRNFKHYKRLEETSLEFANLASYGEIKKEDG